MAQMQKGHCAFSQACAHVDAPHVRISGTNRVMCSPHAALYTSMPSTGGATGNEFSTTAFRPSRSRRSKWMAGVGSGGW
jgi:nitrite reductase/ring-hydroxylating ferredoxin subunit